MWGIMLDLIFTYMYHITAFTIASLVLSAVFITVGFLCVSVYSLFKK